MHNFANPAPDCSSPGPAHRKIRIPLFYLFFKNPDELQNGVEGRPTRFGSRAKSRCSSTNLRLGVLLGCMSALYIYRDTLGDTGGIAGALHKGALVIIHFKSGQSVDRTIRTTTVEALMRRPSYRPYLVKELNPWF